MKKIYKDRLLKLASHLDKGKLGHRKFDFGTWSAGATKKNSCGTVGCAIGECPIIFPSKWKFKTFHEELVQSEFGKTIYHTDPVLKRGSGTSVIDAAAFFGITNGEAHGLFTPSHEPAFCGIKRLPYTATRKQVAANLRRFVIAKEKHEENS
jgi:hypothetical protein